MSRSISFNFVYRFFVDGKIVVKSDEIKEGGNADGSGNELIDSWVTDHELGDDDDRTVNTEYSDASNSTTVISRANNSPEDENKIVMCGNMTDEILFESYFFLNSE